MTLTATSTEVHPRGAAEARRAVVATSIGAALEWFDIIVYASFAIVIAELSSPRATDVSGLMFTFGAFAISYLVRPLGGLSSAATPTGTAARRP